MLRSFLIVHLLEQKDRQQVASSRNFGYYGPYTFVSAEIKISNIRLIALTKAFVLHDSIDKRRFPVSWIVACETPQCPVECQHLHEINHFIKEFP